MKAIITILAFLMFNFTTVQGRTAEEFFVGDTTSIVFPLLPQNARMDMLDYYKVGTHYEADNIFGGKCLLDTITDKYLKVHCSEASDIEVWIPNTETKNTLYVINNTYRVPTPDGKLRILDKNMNELKGIINLPTIKDFIKIPKNSKIKKSQVEDMIDMPFISFTIDFIDGSITATQNLKIFLSAEEYNKIAPYLLDSIKYKWTGKKYKKL